MRKYTFTEMNVYLSLFNENRIVHEYNTGTVQTMPKIRHRKRLKIKKEKAKAFFFFAQKRF